MVTNLEMSILKELDCQKLGAGVIAAIMKRLNTEEKETQFLQYMLINRGVIIPIPDLFDEVKRLSIK